MPKLSTSPTVKLRIRILLKKILEHVNSGLAAPDYLSENFEYRWIDENTHRPKLVIKTKLPFLTELIAQESALPVSKDHIREVLLVLQKKLCILEDNRVKTRGSDAWDFTLKLWHTETDRNLRKFDQVWEQYKAGKRRPSLLESTQIGSLEKYSRQKEKLPKLHNLTLRPDSHFIDSQLVLPDLLMSLAAPNTDAITSIVGPGGIGKTTLALEAAHRCLLPVAQSAEIQSIPNFDVIIFVSAQQKEFLGPYLSEKWQADRSLKDIVREILKTVDRLEGAPFDLDSQIEYVHSILRDHQSLLILDNLETVENPNRLLAFVRTLPQTVKVILTSRTRFGVGKTIELDYLSTAAGFSLITHQARKKLVSLEFSQIQEIYRVSGGLPLAMAYSVGYLSVHRQLPALKQSQSNQPPSEIAQYCVEASLEQLKDEPARDLLMAATFFSDKFSIEAVAYVATLPHQEFDNPKQAFSNLYRLSLVNRVDSVYYSMHGFTQDFVRAELVRHPSFGQVARERWIGWYIELLSPLAAAWFDWQDYQVLEQEWNNIRSLVDWCIEHKRYEALQKLWQGLQSYTLERGYWAERQGWMESLIDMAKEREDSAGLAQAMFYKGQTLLHINETDDQGEALQLLESAWAICPESSPDIRFGILSYLTTGYIKHENPDIAERWLNKSNCSFEPIRFGRERQQCLIKYYTGEIAFLRQQYDVAEESYRQALRLAEATQWKKLIAYSKGWLALVLTEKEEFLDSESLLLAVLKAAKQHKDRRCITKCYYHLAIVAERQDNTESFLEWTALALDAAEKLRMIGATNMMKNWLENKSSGSSISSQ